MAPSPNCMGVLLQKSKKKKVTPNPVFDSLHVVYTPSAEAEDDSDLALVDPSNVKLNFESATSFGATEKGTR